jgi:hypothetical protein
MVRHSYSVSENHLIGTKDVKETYTDSLILCILHYVGLYSNKHGVEMSVSAFKANCNLSFRLPVDSGYVCMKSLLSVLEMQAIRGKGKGNSVTCHRNHRERERERERESRRIAFLVLNFGATWSLVVNATPRPVYPCSRALVLVSFSRRTLLHGVSK